MAHQMATSSSLLMLLPLHSAIAALIEATPWPGRLLRFLTKRSTKMDRCKTIGFRDHRDRPWMQWRGRSSRGALEDMFGSRIWNCLLLSVGNGGCRQDAATFQQQIDNVRIVQNYLELHGTPPKKSKKNLIAEFIMKSVQKVIRWCDAPWTLKRCHGFIHGMEACENNPDASPIYDRIVADAQAWEVMAATVNFKFASIDRIHIARFYRSLHRDIPQRIINHRPSIICVIAYIAVVAIIMQPSIIDCLPLCTGALASELPCQVEGARCGRQAGRGGPRHDDRSGQRVGGCAQGD